MASKDQYLFERNDALDALGLASQIPEVDMDITPTIHFPSMGGEDLSLAKAVYDVAKAEDSEFTVVLEQLGMFYMLTPTGLAMVRAKGKPIFSFKDDEDILGTNIRGFEKYTDNKLLAGMILRKAGVSVPREMHLRQSRYYPIRSSIFGGVNPEDIRSASQTIHERTFSRVLHFLDLHGIEKFVTKPHDGKQGNGVSIEYREHFRKKGAHKDMFDGSDVSDILLIQEKVEPYRLVNQLTTEEMDKLISEGIPLPGQFSDWNMRVLVTYDTSNISGGNYLPVGIVCRIDQVDRPVNISLSASYDSFDNVMRKCGLSREKEVIRRSIEATAVKATEAIVTYCDKKTKRPKEVPDYQVLVGVDIILDRDKNPVVIEINDMNSGCNYELMKLEGVEALYPIARAIIGKARLNKLIEFIKAQVLSAYGPEVLVKLLNGQLKVDLMEDV